MAQSNRHASNDSTPSEPYDDRYGYGDARPDHNNLGYEDTDPYGYGDAAPDGHGDQDPVQYETNYNDEGYAQARSRSNDDGNAMQPDRRGQSGRTARGKSDEWSVATAESYGEYGGSTDDEDGDTGGEPRRTRYRRRGSVTRYSLETAETVKQEYDETAKILDEYRQGGGAATGTPPEKQSETKPCMPDSFDFPIPANPTIALNDDKKDKKSGSLRRYTLR